MNKAYLVLADGTVYTGEAFGAPVNALGELVFNTGMCSYIETVTDPANRGLIVLQTFPLCGNYGVNDEDVQGACSLSGFAVNGLCDMPSNFRSQYSLDSYLKHKGIPGICGLDIRAIARHIRDKGVMMAAIASDPAEAKALLAGGGVGEDLVAAVTCKQPVSYPCENAACHVAALDLGITRGLVREFTKRGCSVTVYPAFTGAQTLLESGCDGVLLSGGPGDPAACKVIADEVKQLMGKVPMFGIGLGHQLMALADGGTAEKMKCGHRGANQPVRDAKTGATYITVQNHGYTVSAQGSDHGTVRFANVNDGTCEGLEYADMQAFSVQFTPAGDDGTRDTAFLYDAFVSMMGGKK